MKKFKAGRYYIGDPCYVIESSEWNKLLNDTNFFRNENQTYKEYQIFADSTAFGDGEYFDQKDRSYLVDAGLIGIIPFEVIEGDGDGGHIVEFKYDFQVSSNEGVFRFGNIVIDTRNR